MSEVMITKLMPPQFNNKVIERTHLIRQLSQNHRKLLLLNAPAGYGKTVLTFQYAKTLAKPLVWYQLDSYDNDPTVFIQHLVAGVQRQLDGFGGEVLQLIGQGNPASRLRVLVTLIINGLAEKAGESGLVLVLDDYHVIDEPLIHNLMQEILEHLPSGIQVIITSRGTPSLSLSRLKVAGEIFTMGIDELRFTSQETREFLAQNQPDFSHELLETLEKQTAGWPAALRLLGDSSAGFVASFVGGVASNEGGAASLSKLNANEIYDYLATEVLDHLPENIQEFLTATSVLETLTPENCNQLLERQDAASIFNYLEKQQLFLISLTGGVKAYRYHHLFREFLLLRLGSKRESLLRRAAKIAWEKGDFDSAVEYLITVPMDQDLLVILKSACGQAFLRGRWQTVSRWLGLLPEKVIHNDYWLCFFQAKVEVYRGRLEFAENLTLKSLAGFTQINDPEGLTECRLLQARILRNRGCYQESLQLLEQAEPYLKEKKRLRFDFLMEKSLCLILTGHFRESESLLTEALRKVEQENNIYIIAYLLEGLGNTYYLAGDFSKALQFYQKGATLSPDRTLPNYYTQDNVAAIYLLWGEIDRAYEIAKKNVAGKELLEMTEVLPSSYYQLGRIRMEQGDLEAAEGYYLKSINISRANKGEYFFLSLTQSYLSQCLGMQGRWEEAKALAAKILEEVNPQASFNLALCQNRLAWVYINTGDFSLAEELLEKSIAALERMGYDPFLSYAYSLMAGLCFLKGNQPAASDYARKSLQMTAKKNYLQDYVTAFQLLKSVLQYGLENDLEVAFIQRLLVHAGPKCLQFLKDLAAHPDPRVREQIILPCSQIHKAEFAAILQTLANDPDSMVQEQARQYIPKIPPELQRKITAKPPLQIHTLGPLRIFWGETELTVASWRTKKARDLLVYLAHQGKPSSLEQILEDLWPEALEKNSAIFHTTLYRLRQTLSQYSDQEFIQSGNKRYYLAPEHFYADSHCFEESLKQNLSGNLSLETSVTQIEEALAMYGGDYLSDLDYSWLIPYREHLNRLYWDACLKLAHHYLGQKAYSRVIETLSPLAVANPLREDIHCLLMTAYAEAGNRFAASKQYETLAAALEDELGLKPAPETRKLYYRLCGAGEANAEE